MPRRYLKPGVMALLLLSVPAALRGQVIETTIKKADGSVVTGLIAGFVVQKGEDAPGAAGTIGYNVIPGEVIASIDENGINLQEGKTFRFITFRLAPTRDDGYYLAWTEPLWQRGSEANSMNISGIGQFAAGTVQGRNLTDRVIGEMRPNGEEEKLYPDIQVSTGSRVVVIPVAQLAPFRSQAR